jgi:hypothetical protein
MAVDEGDLNEALDDLRDDVAEILKDFFGNDFEFTRESGSVLEGMPASRSYESIDADCPSCPALTTARLLRRPTMADSVYTADLFGSPAEVPDASLGSDNSRSRNLELTHLTSLPDLTRQSIPLRFQIGYGSGMDARLVGRA